ncbi:two-component responsive regulator-related /response regulator protein-related [Striga asiatica]|uniref:Two-component responsive regulator-related /response regulator protein-related n=1 Tax=Striga asiatica TaxID=4170 RepID=A0A5A7PP70_STRAF|nr:two-component responsive regulator-related /response regulator protein-related [Striga asiatica]
MKNDSSSLDKVTKPSKVQPHDCVGEEARVLLRVPLRHVHHVRLQDGRPLPATRLVHACHRPVVPEPVVPADAGEPRHAPLVVEQVEPLGAGGRRQSGDNVDDPDVAGGESEALGRAAALDEVLIELQEL